MKIINIRHNYPEKSGWELKRNNCPDYILLHFLTPVNMEFNGKSVQAEPGNAIIFPPYSNHRLSATKPLLHNWAHLGGNVLQYMEASGVQPDRLYTPAYTDKITDIFRTLESEFFAKQSDFDTFTSLKLQELFLYLGRPANHRPVNEYNSGNLTILSGLRRSLILDLDQAWSIERMCKLTSMSQSRLFTLYKSIYGISPIKDLVHARIERAKSLLSQNHYPNSELCKLCGFNNEYYFIRQFKRLTGKTPSTY